MPNNYNPCHIIIEKLTFLYKENYSCDRPLSIGTLVLDLVSYFRSDKIRSFFRFFVFLYKKSYLLRYWLLTVEIRACSLLRYWLLTVEIRACSLLRYWLLTVEIRACSLLIVLFIAGIKRLWCLYRLLFQLTLVSKQYVASLDKNKSAFCVLPVVPMLELDQRNPSILLVGLVTVGTCFLGGYLYKKFFYSPLPSQVNLQNQTSSTQNIDVRESVNLSDFQALLENRKSILELSNKEEFFIDLINERIKPLADLSSDTLFISAQQLFASLATLNIAEQYYILYFVVPAIIGGGSAGFGLLHIWHTHPAVASIANTARPNSYFKRTFNRIKKLMYYINYINTVAINNVSTVGRRLIDLTHIAGVRFWPFKRKRYMAK